MKTITTKPAPSFGRQQQIPSSLNSSDYVNVFPGQHTSSPFITLQGYGTGVTDLLFHYPNQVPTSATVPNVYPYTILMTGPGTKVARSTVTNAYNFLDIEGGRIMAHDLFIGAFNTGVNVQRAQDHVSLSHILNQVFWDILENATYPRPIDTWVLNHGAGMVVGEADLEFHDFFVFSRFAGIVLNSSCTDPGSDLDLQNVQYGIMVATGCAGPGWEFTNVKIGAAPGLGQAAVQLPTAGSLPPKIEINGGSQQGVWALGAYSPTGPDVIIVNILP